MRTDDILSHGYTAGMALYETLAGIYDELFPVSTKALEFIEAASSLETRKGLVLDAGSATGGHALALARGGWEVLGLEPSSRMVEIARRRAAAEGLASARFEAADMNEASRWVDPGSLDLLLCLGNTLPHLPDIEAVGDFLHLARTLLKGSGALVLQLVNYGRSDIGPGFAFPMLRTGELRFLRRYEEAHDAEGKPKPGSLSFVTELARTGKPTARTGKPTARTGPPVERDSTRLLAIRPGALLLALHDAGFTSSFHSSWEGSGFHEDRDVYLMVLARPKAP